MRKLTKLEALIVFLLLAAVSLWLKRYFLLQRGYVSDISTFIAWSNQIKEGGFWSLYSSNYQVGVDYPPLIPLIGSFWMSLQGLFHLNVVQHFKLLPTIFELIMTIVTVIFLSRSNTEYKNFLIGFVIVQPALALITSAWGQVDSILSLFIIIGFLLIDTNLYLTSLFLFLALLVKPQALFAILVFFLIVLIKKGFINALKQVGFWIVMAGIMFFIFKSHGADFLAVYLLSAGRYPHLSMNAFNFWWLLEGARATVISDSIGSLSSKTLGLTLFATLLVPAIYYIKQKAKGVSDYFLVVSFTYLLFFVFTTQMHERYLFPAVALMPFAVTNKRLLGVYVLLSITLFLNNYAVLQAVYPQFSSFLSSDYPRLVSGGWTQIVSIINVLIALFMALYLGYESFKTSK